MNNIRGVEMMSESNLKIGFVGQGWIGKNYADDFETRGHNVVRYALEEPYVNNKDQIKECDITFIAVPTPTTPEGFDDSYLRSSLETIGEGNIAVIKSTTYVGLVKILQSDFPDVTILHSPEFLVEKTAAFDAANPNRNLIGLPVDTMMHKNAADILMYVLPDAPYSAVMTSDESELVKYAGNCFLYSKVVFMNTLYDLTIGAGADYGAVQKALISDPRIGESHTIPVHDSGRGAGGHCFIKDFEAYRQLYIQFLQEGEGLDMLSAMVNYNNMLLTDSGKNLDLLEEIYSKEKLPIKKKII